MIVVCRVTTRCNLACGFCAYDRRLPFTRTSIDDAAIEHLIGLLRAHRETHPQRILLSWLGGEPLLWPRWQHWSRHAREAGIAVSATTNGTALSRADVRSAIVENFSELTISIDALGATHDALRGWPGGFERVCAGITALAGERARTGARLLLRVNVVLMRRTVTQFAALARHLQGLGVDEISFNLLGGRDRPEFHAAEAVEIEALEQLVAGLPRLRQQLSQEIAAIAAPTRAAPAAAKATRILGDAGYSARLAAASRGSRWPVTECHPGEHFLFVDEHGRVAPCAFTGDELGVPILEQGSIDALPARMRTLRARALPRICSDCPSTQLAGKFAGVDLGEPPSATRIPGSA